MAETLTPSSLPYDADQYALAAELSKRRARIAHSIGDSACNDATTIMVGMFTASILKPSPANTEVHETTALRDSETDQRALGNLALAPLMRRSLLVREALDYQDAYDDVLAA